MKFLVLGIDQSITQTGLALYRVPGDERMIECDSFASRGASNDDKCHSFGARIKERLGPLAKRKELAFVCWEQARGDLSAYAASAQQLLLPEIQGQIRQFCIDYRIPYEAVPTSTWRGALWPGYGHISRPEAKAKAKEYCRLLGIKASNENEAEAACIARWAATCSQRFKMLRFRLEAEAEAAA